MQDPAGTATEVENALARLDPNLLELRVSIRGKIGDLALKACLLRLAATQQIVVGFRHRSPIPHKSWHQHYPQQCDTEQGFDPRCSLDRGATSRKTVNNITSMPDTIAAGRSSPRAANKVEPGDCKEPGDAAEGDGDSRQYWIGARVQLSWTLIMARLYAEGVHAS